MTARTTHAARGRRPDHGRSGSAVGHLLKGGLALGAGAAAAAGLSSPAGATIERALAIGAAQHRTRR